LRVIEMYEHAGKRPNTFNIAAEVYQVEPDQDGNRLISEAQHVATKRALASLRRKGLVAGQRDPSASPTCSKSDRAIAAEIGVSVSTMRRARVAAGERYAKVEQCCLWSRQAAPHLQIAPLSATR
jgi:hypothetical protein